MKYLTLLKSRTFWSVFVLFLVSGVDGIRSYINPSALEWIQGALSLAVMYFRANPVQSFEK